jgi:5-methyltetrahydrofolate--homocysteine methyltransferase
LDVREYLKNRILIFDGAMGTMLQQSGLKTGELPEVLNIKESSKITEIHKEYIKAGAKVITTNTFGANEIKLKKANHTVEEIIDKAVENAKKAALNKDVFIALDIGPTGELLEPSGSFSFEDAYKAFKRQVIQGVKSGVDLILIETMTDLYEAKAAVLAAKENSNLPVFCTMSFEASHRTFMGCSATSMVMVLQGLGVDALGVNCSLGPEEIEPILDEILSISKIPVMVQPNAGIPHIENGKTVFDVTPDDFAKYGTRFVQKGVRIVGGCCGTTYDHIKSLASSVKDLPVKKPLRTVTGGVCTSTNALFIDNIKVIGERINPTGKKLLKEALKNSDIDYVVHQAISQTEAGADILDINVGLPEIDQVETMAKVVKEIQKVLINVPLQIDSSSPEVIEKALKVYNGKAIVNSVSGEDKTLNSILPVVKKYGAAVIGLTLDEKGIPSTAEERLAIAEKIIKRAEQYGIDREDVFIDCLTLTAAAQQKDVFETLKAVSLVKEKLNVKTILGVSNVSFGLPQRGLLNRTFLAEALSFGLDLPIINPLDKDMMDTIKASRVLLNMDRGSSKYIESFKDTKNEINAVKKQDNDLYNIVVSGIKDSAKDAAAELLKVEKPLDVVNKYIITALDTVGEKYEKGEMFLPELMQSADTVKAAFEVIKEKIKEDPNSSVVKGKVILATVNGDIHDIGKNIAKVLLENYGFEVIDLGKDVSSDMIIEAIKIYNIKLVGLSALMTTTVKSMEETIMDIKKNCPGCKVMAGGAVLTDEYAKLIGADFYTKDAMEGVKIAQKVFENIDKK